MNSIHYIRVGILGDVGRFTSSDAATYPRGRRVICRTRRGLEVGEVLHAQASATGVNNLDGTLLRAVTAEDDLLLARLRQHKEDAFQACVELLARRHIDAVLMDVEHLFDGKSLYFYFLGEVTSDIEAVTQELANAYEAKVQFRRFTDAVTNGCGPNCGTDEASCGSETGCSSCAIASACRA